MKTYTAYTIPAVSTLADNEIKNLSDIADVKTEVRLVRLRGVPVRIKLDKTSAEITSYDDEDLEGYDAVFEKLLKLFYGTTYIYGHIFEEKFVAYDIYTNDNFLSVRDMDIVSRETGLVFAEPILSGMLTFEHVIEMLHKKINEGVPPDELHILPSMYLKDNRAATVVVPKETTNLVYGERKAYTYQMPTQQFQQSPKKKEQKIVDRPDVYLLSTKEERTAIFKETFKNISDYITANEKFLDKEALEWWNKYGKSFAYIYAIHTLPATRKLIYKYAETFYLDYTERYSPVIDKWALLFMSFFDDMYKDTTLMRKNQMELYATEYFSDLFHDELNEFDKFYSKESNNKFDWRNGQNFYQDLGYLYGE